MRSKAIFPIFFAFILASSFSNNAEALTCVQTFPIVGTVGTITTSESYFKIRLDNVYIFDTRDFEVNQVISIDRYVDTVNAYVKNNFRLSEKLNLEDGEWLNKVFFPTKALDAMSLNKGDIIIHGPPFGYCSYRFSGVFKRDGKLRYAVVNDSYQDYSYRNSKLIVEAGNELECDNNICKVEVNYQLDDKLFRLRPGQSYTPTGNLIKSITLLDSRNLKKRSDDTEIFDLGDETYATYVISFQDSVKPAEPAPAEKWNIFQKIWQWFVSWFK